MSDSSVDVRSPSIIDLANEPIPFFTVSSSTCSLSQGLLVISALNSPVAL
ncbi:MAG: hypothetical protein WA783_16670 [Phormidesmis sp.]